MLENMSTQMEVDDNATATTLSRTSCVEPSVKNFSFCQEREEIVHRLFFWCHEELLWSRCGYNYSKVYKAVD